MAVNDNSQYLVLYSVSAGVILINVIDCDRYMASLIQRSFCVFLYVSAPRAADIII